MASDRDPREPRPRRRAFLQAIAAIPVATGLTSPLARADHPDRQRPGRTVVEPGTRGVRGPTGKLRADDGSSLDRFGFSVAIDEAIAVVGAPFDDDQGTDSGSAYVFTPDGSAWRQRAKLTAEDGASVDRFGYSLEVSGDSIVVGAPFDDADDERRDTGAAYVFTSATGTWERQATLVASDAAPVDTFGRAVAIDEDVVVVGANGDAIDDVLGVGSAYVFARTDGAWNQQAKLSVDTAGPRENFGESVAVSGETIVVGTQNDDENGLDAGAAYVYTRTDDVWEQEAKLLADDGDAVDFFGCAVDVSGDIAVVGALGKGDQGLSSGAAYVFARTDDVWEQEAKLLADDGAPLDGFGEAVAVSDTTVVVGASGDDIDDVAGVGSAYEFIRTGAGWQQAAKLVADDGDATDRFGMAVSVAADTALVGSQFHNGDAPNSPDFGAAYAFDV